jgi:hypothetical protein
VSSQKLRAHQKQNEQGEDAEPDNDSRRSTLLPDEMNLVLNDLATEQVNNLATEQVNNPAIGQVDNQPLSDPIFGNANCAPQTDPA